MTALPAPKRLFRRLTHRIVPALFSLGLAALLVAGAGCGERHQAATGPAAPRADQPVSSSGGEDQVSRVQEAPAPDWRAIPLVPLHPQSQQQSVHEAMVSHQHPERLSLQQPAPPFVLASYRSHPEGYLDVIEPGRVFAPAHAASGVPRFGLIGDSHLTVASGSVIALSAQVAPRAPLIVTTLDGGVFENGLSTITIQADDSGLGTVHFTATAGTVADVRILAASPMTSGQGHWLIGITTSSGHS